MAARSKKTTDHDEIRKWAEKRGGNPATVERTERDDEAGVLRIEFPTRRGKGKAALAPISWDEFFEKFDEKNLVFLYQEKTATGRPSRFCKFLDGDKQKTE